MDAGAALSLVDDVAAAACSCVGLVFGGVCCAASARDGRRSPWSRVASFYAALVVYLSEMRSSRPKCQERGQATEEVRGLGTTCRLSPRTVPDAQQNDAYLTLQAGMLVPYRPLADYGSQRASGEKPRYRAARVHLRRAHAANQ